MSWPILRDQPLSAGIKNLVFIESDGHVVFVNKCLGCKKIHIELLHVGHEEFELVYPSTRVRKLNYDTVSIPPHIKNDYDEAALIESLSPGASAAIARRGLQNVIKDRYHAIIKDAFNLKRQVELILNANILPSHISEELHGIRSIGNHSAHTNVDPATNEIIEVSRSEASACLDVLEQILDFCYVQPALAKKRKEDREKKFGPDTK